MTQPINRRTFLALGAGAVAWACGRDNTAGPSPSPSAAGTSLVLTTDPNGLLGVGDRRLAFAVFRNERPISPAEVQAALTPPEGRAPGRLTAEPVDVAMGQGGNSPSEVSQIYVVTHEMQAAGPWALQATVDGQRLTASFEVSEDGQKVPLVGEKAPAVPSATTDDPRGVDPICTRDPMCSMHDMTIEEAVTSGEPSVIIFATPRFCTSRTCGPVVDIVEAAKEKTDGVSFVHIEVWKDTDSVGSPDALVQPMRDYNLPTEPATFFIDGEGVVRARWFGALGAEEVAAAAEALKAGRL